MHPRQFSIFESYLVIPETNSNETFRDCAQYNPRYCNEDSSLSELLRKAQHTSASRQLTRKKFKVPIVCVLPSMKRLSRSSYEPETSSQNRGLRRGYFLKIVSLALHRNTRCDPKLSICGGCIFQKRGFWPSGIHSNYPLFQKIKIVCSVPLTLIGLKLSVFVARTKNRFPFEWELLVFPWKGAAL